MYDIQDQFIQIIVQWVYQFIAHINNNIQMLQKLADRPNKTICLPQSLMILLIITLTHQRTIKMSIDTDNTQISSTARYTININRQIDPINFQFFQTPTKAQIDTIIVITFPSQFLNIATGTSVPCKNLANGLSLTCIINNSIRTITITNYYGTEATLQDKTLNIRFQNIINAYRAAKSNNFQWKLVLPNNSVLDQGPPATNSDFSTSITFTPGNFQSCSIDARLNLVSSQSGIHLKFLSTNNIPTSGQMVLSLPEYWLSDPLQVSVVSNAPSCMGISNTGNAVSCSYSQSKSPIQHVITISNLAISNQSQITIISISNILIPPTVASPQSIFIYSQWPDAIRIDTCSSSISNIQAAPFQPASISSNNNTVQSNFTATLDLTISRTFTYTDTIVFDLPQQFAFMQVSSINFNTFTQSTNLLSLTLSNFPSSPAIITANSRISFTLTNLRNAMSTAQILLKVSFYRNNLLYQQQTLSYNSVSAIIQNFAIAPQNNLVNSIGSATITLQPTIAFPANSIIIITYPSTISSGIVANRTITMATLNGIVRLGASYTVSNNQITLSNLFISDFIGILIITIDMFYNPATVQPSIYLLSVLLPLNGNLYGVMTGFHSISAITRPLISNSIIASSYKVLDTAVTYTINIVTNHPFTSISIIIPSDVTIQVGLQSTCAPNIYSFCKLTANNLTFSGAGTLSSGSHSLSWGFNKNPNSFQPTSTFKIFTYSKGWGVQNSQGVITLAMNITALFSFLVYPSSYHNSGAISLTLLMTFPENFPSGKLMISVPNEINIRGSSCAQCTIIPPSIFVDLNEATSNLTLVLTDIKNVGSFKPVNSFHGWLSKTNSYQSLYATAIGWSNSIQTTFSTNVYGNNNFRNELNTFVFQVDGLSEAQQYIILGIDTSFGGLSSNPSGAVLINNYTVKYPCSGASCTFSLTILNPMNLANYTFQLKSYDSENYLVGSGRSNVWTFDCLNTNCRSCDTSNKCINCYSSNLTTHYIYNTNSQDCIRNCASGYFLLNNITCSICDSNCNQCTNTSKTCINCAQNYFLDTTNKICSLNCPVGYFNNALNRICTQCDSKCRNCSDSANNCWSCSISFYLLNNECLSNCPLNYYIKNDVGLTCDPCGPTCLTCQTSTISCLTCNNSIGLFLEINRCVKNCSLNYFIHNNLCVYCEFPCRTCQTSHTTCSSCFLNSSQPIYFKNYCIASQICPIGHYILSVNSSCQICPINCTQCSSSNFCTQCSTQYYLYQNLCITSCPNTTYIVVDSFTGICSPCIKCLTCNSAAACTSCISNQFFYLEKCYNVCPNDTFGDNLKCIKCSSNCQSCLNLTYCLSCFQAMLLYRGVCYLSCPTGSYVNTTSQLCLTCGFSCTSCSSLNTCHSCIENYSFQDSKCVFICSKGISFNQICYPCGLNCQNCVNTTCILCSNGYYIYNKGCVSQCPSNMLSFNNQTCVVCTQKFINCSTCLQDRCLSCSYGQLVNSLCIPCSPGTFDLSGSCSPCSSICSTCLSQSYCTTCVANYYLLEATCSSICPRNMVPNGTTCSFCLDQCAVCNQVTSICEICVAGVYLHNNLCNSNCPKPLVVSYDFLTCVTQRVYFQQFIKSARIVPFPFTILICILIIVGIILKCYNKQMHLATSLCALLSFVQYLTWLIFITFQSIYFSNYHHIALNNIISAAIALAFLGLLNALHLIYYYKYINTDEDFKKWIKKYSCSNLSIIIIATIFTFKFYRFVHSKFLSRNQLSMILSSPNKLVPFALVGLISILFCSVPILVGCGLALYNSVDKDQQFYIALDTVVVTCIMILLLLMDLKHPDDYFSDQPEIRNLKKKMYLEQSINIGGDSKNVLDQNASNEQLIEVIDDQGEMALPPSANKFNSTFDSNRKNGSIVSNIKRIKQQYRDSLMVEAKNKDMSECYEQQSEIVQEEQDNKGMNKKWIPKKYDHHGYQIRYDQHNNPILYDQNGFLVQIDQQGRHHRYNQQNQEMRLINGHYYPHDQQGFLIKNGRLYDQRGYQVRRKGEVNAFYDELGFEVIGHGDEEMHVDEVGNKILVQKDGNIKRYQSDGYEVVQYKGQKLLKNSQGSFVRQNSKGKFQQYDPDDGFILKINDKTGRYQKYNDLGYRVVKDKYGVTHYYDQKGFKVTILSGNQIIKHNQKGYRVQEDQDGSIHLFDEEGYQVVQNENGSIIFKDQYGYRIQRDIYGKTTRYDSEGNIVLIDCNGKHRTYTQEGLQIIVDKNGNRILLDKRGRVVEQIDEDTYNKYDQEGNKIWLDENGYELSQDQNEVRRYDKIGNMVESDQQINEFDEQKSEKAPNNRVIRSKFDAGKLIDHEKELQVLLAKQQHKGMLQSDSDIQELIEFHHKEIQQVSQRDMEYELGQLTNRQRNLLFEEQNLKDYDLPEFNQKQKQLQHMKDDDNNIEIFESLFNPAISLNDKQTAGQQRLDRELNMRNIEQKSKIGQTILGQNGRLRNAELNKQTQFDKQAYLKDLDEKQPDIQLIKRRQELQQRKQAEVELGNNLQTDEEGRIQIKSVADISIDERSFDNEGVEPLQNRTDFDEINSLDGLQIPLGKKQRGNRSQLSLINKNKKQTNTVYNYNTINVEIKNKNKIYDQQEEIQSLKEQDWQQQINPMQFQRGKIDSQRYSNHHTNANTNVFYIEQVQQDIDTLTDFVHQSQTKRDKPILNRNGMYQKRNQIFSGNAQSIEDIEQRLFREAQERGIRQRKQFKLSGAANPLVQYAKKIEANKRSMQERNYLQQVYKRR